MNALEQLATDNRRLTAEVKQLQDVRAAANRELVDLRSRKIALEDQVARCKHLLAHAEARVLAQHRRLDSEISRPMDAAEALRFIADNLAHEYEDAPLRGRFRLASTLETDA